ncbi:hypothetical protein QJS04_geneDACA020870 [Acorus gramineus]|uniref:Activator of Hsp90 ATPase AHSA1-like N-terminal domain-containing protein n=1 Tax=Acorus gramineus TaxID=55184 RepID=A0AAV9BPZ4_ACOGR|nr:hypothetical protein QJS04_geneDACA020870 [Acorus gramineus]
MAKYGEGDKRWIVEDRPDGTNVHHWHWSERDCLEWSRSLLSSLLSGLTIPSPASSDSDDLHIRTKSLDRLDGEAYVNIRKGKVIPGYELSLSLSWIGEAKSSAASVEGTVEIPYIADENAGEDPEIKVTVRDGGPVGARLKEAFLARGKPVVLEKIRVFVDAMAKGGPAKDDLEVKKPKSAAAVAAPQAGKEEEEEEKRKKKREEEKGKEGFKTIQLSERFNCSARVLYEILMDERRWKGFTQSNARISGDVGGEFSLFDGSIMGTNVELQEGKVIVQKWRFGSWPDGVYSTVRLTFDEPESGVTIAKLTQTEVPEEDRYGNSTVVENTERGWRELIFHKIRAVFGFGI